MGVEECQGMFFRNAVSVLRAGGFVPISYQTMKKGTYGEKKIAGMAPRGGGVNNEGSTVRRPPESQAHKGPQPSAVRLGEVLIRAGRINADQLEKALEEQGLSRKRIGEILLEKGYIKPEELTHSLNVQSMLLSAGLTTVLSLGSTLGGESGHPVPGAKTGKGTVKTPVRSHLAVQYQTPKIVVTDYDVQTGYVQLRAATRLVIKSNNRPGCLLVFEGLKWPFRKVLVHGLANEMEIKSTSGSVHQPYSKSASAFELSYEFLLSEDARTGEYVWPLSISLQPV
jgi:hypothetical protein